MAIFNRSKNQKSVLPEEVNQYYQSQRRERAGVAIILGVVALVVTLLLGLALFYGGRALYNRLNDKDEPKNINTISETQKKNDNKEQGSDGTNGASSSSQPSTPAQQTPSTTPSTTPATSTPSTPNTGDQPQTSTPAALPSTGDEGM